MSWPLQGQKFRKQNWELKTLNTKIKIGEATVLNSKFVSLKIRKTKLELKILNTKIKIGEATVFTLKVCELAAPRPKVKNKIGVENNEY